jgi:hypothetical protein
VDFVDAHPVEQKASRVEPVAGVSWSRVAGVQYRTARSQRVGYCLGDIGLLGALRRVQRQRREFRFLFRRFS